jgi:hypothetical protein
VFKKQMKRKVIKGNVWRFLFYFNSKRMGEL